MVFLLVVFVCIYLKFVGLLYGLSMLEVNYCFMDIIIDIGVEWEGIDVVIFGFGFCNDSVLVLKVFGNLWWFCVGYYFWVFNKVV